MPEVQWIIHNDKIFGGDGTATVYFEDFENQVWFFVGLNDEDLSIDISRLPLMVIDTPEEYIELSFSPDAELEALTGKPQTLTLDNGTVGLCIGDRSSFHMECLGIGSVIEIRIITNPHSIIDTVFPLNDLKPLLKEKYPTLTVVDHETGEIL